MAEVSSAPKDPERGENVAAAAGASALPRSSTVPANSSDTSNFTPTPLRASLSSPIGVEPEPQQDGRKNSRVATGNYIPGISTSSQTVLDANAESSAIDPLSQHIIKRTNTQKSIPQKLLGRASYEADAGGNDRYSQSEQGSNRGDAVTRQRSFKDKKKGVSFLSRIIGGKKKDLLSDAEDDASEADASRMDADAAQPIGFIPRFPRPPKYLRVRAHYKKERTFDRVFVAQELEDNTASDTDRPSSSSTAEQNDKRDGKAVWAMAFSNDGRYLATAGQDKKVRVWAVIASPDDRDSDVEGDAHSEYGPPPLKAPVFKSKPVQVYEGHTGSILDLSWSKNNFLLSSSMDKTVCLWHVTRPECLCCFKHGDFVTSIQFHPRDDRFFLAGSLDTKLRLWSIPDKSIAFVTTVPDMVTAVSFTPDGRHAIAGSLNGICTIYETDGLKPIAQLHVRSARGRNSKGSKITGIDTITMSRGGYQEETKLLITSNDSRIRLYNFRDRTLEAKFRGNENTCSQIRASFSDDGKHVICGSEDRRAYIWPVGPVEKDSDKRAVEVFETRTAMVTAAVMAPAKTKQILNFSEDPIYDICNPPPVTLGDHSNSASTTKQGNLNDDGSRNRNSRMSKVAQESPAYLARSTHPDGNIIIVADYSGKIKVLRQDCAYHKRRYESLDTGSISRRILGRSNSARRSIASSIGRESSHKTPSERIISWRNSVIGHELGLKGSRTGSPVASRSSSPGRGSPVQTESRPSNMVSPSPSDYKSSMDSHQSSNGEAARRHMRPADPSISGLSSTTLIANGKDKEDPLWLRGDHSYAFWSKITHDALAANSRKSHNLLSPDRIPSSERKHSMGSALSSDYASSNGDGDDGDVLKCENCRSTNFQGLKTRDGKQMLVCVACRRPVI